MIDVEADVREGKYVIGDAEYMMVGSGIGSYRSAILGLREGGDWGKEDLLTPAFLMRQEGDVEIYYAPHNEVVNTEAQLVIVGITPGWTQMKLAYQAARAGLEAGLSDMEVCLRAKEEARFAGTMREHLIQMLDQIGLAEGLHISSCRELFQQQSQILHTTSLLRYPVFVNHQNYTGSRPNLLTASWLREQAQAYIVKELQLMGRRKLIIPLGKTVERLLAVLEEEGRLDGGQVLKGFPHPSGANGHRKIQFHAHEEQMRRIVSALFP